MIGSFGLHPKGTMSARALPLAHELAARGHEVKINMPPWHTPEDAGRSWEEAGVHLEYVPLGPRLPLLSHLMITFRLVQRALVMKPEVIHCFKPKAYAGLAAWALWHLYRLGLIHASLVIDEDDWEGPGGWNALESYSPWLRALFAWQERWGLRHNDAVTVASRTLQSLVWSLGVSPRKVHYLPNAAKEPQRGDGRGVRKRHNLGEAPVVLLYTRFYEFDVARGIAVFRRIMDELPTVRFLVVGAALFPQDDARFDHLLAEAGLGQSVVRAGWVSMEKLADHFAACDVALYPLDDTLVNRAKCSVKLIELLAAGLPVVADAVGQSAEYIVHDESGLLVPPGDAAAMAEAAIRLLRDEALRRSLSSAAAARIAQRFSWPALADQALMAYGQGNASGLRFEV